MKRLLNFGQLFGLVLLALVLTQGCSQSLHSSDATSAASQETLPFHSGTDKPSEGGAGSAVSPDLKTVGDLPFRPAARTRTLPAGTLLTVQLEEPLSVGKFHAGDAFAASVAAPLAVEGNTLIDRGAAVTGSIESIQAPAPHNGLARASGYFRLTLNAIDAGGKPVAIQTSSLFARGTSQRGASSAATADSSDGIRLQKGHRLTFRLTTPVVLNDPAPTSKSAMPKAQS